VKQTIILALAALSLTAAAGNEALSPVFDQYLEMQAALAGDDYAGAVKAAKALSQTVADAKADGLDNAAKKAWQANVKSLQDGLKKAAAAGDIKAVRAPFETISNALIAVAGAAQPEGVKRYHCPMAFNNKGADWLQKGETTSNPYFGASMLRCGYWVRK